MIGRAGGLPWHLPKDLQHFKQLTLDHTVIMGRKTLEEIKDTKGKTSDRIRALIRDLHRSPLGRAGLEEALHGFISEVGRGSEVRFHTDISEVALPAPIALLVYHRPHQRNLESVLGAGRGPSDANGICSEDRFFSRIPLP